MVEVVLDPFPVGGGRSSLEVLAVGTPIVMLYNRTSILQVKSMPNVYYLFYIQTPVKQGLNTAASIEQCRDCLYYGGP